MAWTLKLENGVQVFTSHEGIEYVFARKGEEPDRVVVVKHRGVGPVKLVLKARSQTLRRAHLKTVREKRALRKRGYDV